MKISISSGTGAARQTTILADDDAGIAVVAWQPRRSKQTQIAQFIRAAQSRPYDRKNRLTSIAFSVNRDFASQSSMFQWIQDHFTNLPNEGTLDIEMEGQRSYMLYAQMDDVAVTDQRGVTCTLSYTVTGGQLSPS